MNQNPIENQRPESREQLAIRITIATPEDWEAYKELRLLAITSEDKEMFDVSKHPDKVEKEQNRTEQEWRDLLSQSDRFVVLYWEGVKAIGMGVISKKEKYWELGGGYVKKEFQGKKIGQKIFAKRLQEIQIRGGTKVRTGMEETNKRSIHIAEIFGFKQTQEDLDEVGDFEMELKDVSGPEIAKKIEEILNAG
ncbi:MAG: GNAT family N-acetyltransferase [bacterium]